MPDHRRSRVTVKDVAAKVGVSPMTVSNAYNRPDQLSAGLRERVLRTAQAMGYAGPSRVARDLRLGSPSTVGVVYDTPLAYAVSDPAAAAFLGGVATALNHAETYLLLLAQARPAAAAQGADGLIVYSVADTDRVLATALDRRVPLVIVDQPEIPQTPFVATDDRDGARLAAEHLLALGHRDIAVLAFGLRNDGRSGLAGADRRSAAAYRVTRERLAGYEQAAMASGIVASALPVYEASGADSAAARTAAEELLSRTPRPTGVLAMSDDLAMTVIEAAHDAGIRVPADLSVVGFDDVCAASRARPALTTVHQDHEGKGRIATELLLARLRGEEQQGSGLLPTKLVVRSSTARAQTRGDRDA